MIFGPAHALASLKPTSPRSHNAKMALSTDQPSQRPFTPYAPRNKITRRPLINLPDVMHRGIRANPAHGHVSPCGLCPACAGRHSQHRAIIYAPLRCRRAIIYAPLRCRANSSIRLTRTPRRFAVSGAGMIAGSSARRAHHRGPRCQARTALTYTSPGHRAKICRA